MTEAHTDAVCAAGLLTSAELPPPAPMPRHILGIASLASRQWALEQSARRYGPVFTLNVPVFGRAVVIADPDLAQRVFTTSTDELVDVAPPLSRVWGPGSLFGLDSIDHRDRRGLLGPLLHGENVQHYEQIVVEETLRETSCWPEGREFRSLEAMMRITLNVTLRAVFAAQGHQLRYLRQLLPGWVKLGSRLAVLPEPPISLRRYSPWGRLDRSRRNFDAVLRALIDIAEADPRFDERTDILSQLLRSTYENGSLMSWQDIGDTLLTLVAAAHDTTAATLGWALERLSRHPHITAALQMEADTDSNELRQAAICEVQRVRTVIDVVGRRVAAPLFTLGPWRIPRGTIIVVGISLLHANSEVFSEPQQFNPYRFIGNTPAEYAWIPFGGGTRRCIGAALANTQMDVVLRTVLREVIIEDSTMPDEKIHRRGAANTPSNGATIVVRRR